jgi:hypothetical protein
VTGYYKGNVVFMATSTAETCLKNNVLTVEFATGNTYGVLFDSFALKRFDGRGARLYVLHGPKLSGRQETIDGWDDLVLRGIQRIETDYPGFGEVYPRTERPARLEKPCTQCRRPQPIFSKGRKFTRDDAANALLTKGAVSKCNRGRAVPCNKPRICSTGKAAAKHKESFG